MVSGQQSVALPFGKDKIIEMARSPRAIHLYALLKSTRNQEPFTVPQEATARLLNWGKEPLRKAIDDLIKFDLMEIDWKDQSTAKQKKATLYSFKAPPTT